MYYRSANTVPNVKSSQIVVSSIAKDVTVATWAMTTFVLGFTAVFTLAIIVFSFYLYWLVAYLSLSSALLLLLF